MQKCKCWGAKWTKKGVWGGGGGSSCYIKKVVWRPPPPQKERQHCAEAEVIKDWVEWVSGVRRNTAKPRAKPRPWAGMDLTTVRGSTDPLACLPQMSDSGQAHRGGCRNWETSVRTLVSVSRQWGCMSELVCQVVPLTIRAPHQRTEEDPEQRGQETPTQNPEWSVSRRRIDCPWVASEQGQTWCSTSHHVGENVQRDYAWVRPQERDLRRLRLSSRPVYWAM